MAITLGFKEGGGGISGLCSVLSILYSLHLATTPTTRRLTSHREGGREEILLRGYLLFVAVRLISRLDGKMEQMTYGRRE